VSGDAEKMRVLAQYLLKDLATGFSTNAIESLPGKCTVCQCPISFIRGDQVINCLAIFTVVCI